mgnify:CR=1 FL=1
MERRSTNDVGYTHFGGDITAHVNSSHGVRLSGGSTGGLIEAVGDDTNVSLTIRAQGTGSIRIGTTGQSVTMGNSTTAIAGTQRYLVQYTIPALSSGPAASESTVAVVGLTTNSILVFQPRLISNSTGFVQMSVRCSTADELTILFANQSASSLSGSTHSAYLLQFRF